MGGFVFAGVEGRFFLSFIPLCFDVPCAGLVMMVILGCLLIFERGLV